MAVLQLRDVLYIVGRDTSASWPFLFIDECNLCGASLKTAQTAPRSARSSNTKGHMHLWAAMHLWATIMTETYETDFFSRIAVSKCIQILKRGIVFGVWLLIICLSNISHSNEKDYTTWKIIKRAGVQHSKEDMEGRHGRSGRSGRKTWTMI